MGRGLLSPRHNLNISYDIVIKLSQLLVPVKICRKLKKSDGHRHQNVSMIPFNWKRYGPQFQLLCFRPICT